jgi:hypothetical protein
MVDLAMCFQNYVVDYTTQKRNKKDLIEYLVGEPTTSDAEPSNILVLFPLLLL